MWYCKEGGRGRTLGGERSKRVEHSGAVGLEASLEGDLGVRRGAEDAAADDVDLEGRLGLSSGMWNLHSVRGTPVMRTAASYVLCPETMKSGAIGLGCPEARFAETASKDSAVMSSS
jgi:hypothetical protein